MKPLIQILLLTLMLLVTGVSNAQFIPTMLTVSATPSSPSPGEVINIQANTPTLDKNRIFFEWTVDGRPRTDLSGPGKDSIKLTAGPVGSTIRVTVAIFGADQDAKPASLAVIVSELSLNLFAETYTPRWYKGKALPTQNSLARIIAVPQIAIGGALLRPENLIYRWSLNDQTDALSGIGQQVFRFRLSDLPKTLHQIRVAVEDGEGIIRKEGRIFVSAVTPQVKIYPASPLGGVEFRSSSAFLLTKIRGLFDSVAEPFFFSASSRKNLRYLWRVSGAEVAGTPENPNFLTIDTMGQPAGLIPINITVDDDIDIIPPAAKNLNLILQ